MKYFIERLGKSVISVRKKAQNSIPADVLWGRNECVTNEPQRMSAGRLGPKGLIDAFYGCKKVEKTFWFCGLFIF